MSVSVGHDIVGLLGNLLLEKAARGSNKAEVAWGWVERSCAELRMGLHANEEWMVCDRSYSQSLKIEEETKCWSHLAVRQLAYAHRARHGQ